jgi:hypothetical protein
MTPLVVSYCRSLFYVLKREERRNKILSMLNGLTSTNKEKKSRIKKIETKITLRSIDDLKKTSDWVIEINRLGWEVCKSLCHIDIPVWDDDLQKVIYLCFNKDTKQDSIWWHDANFSGIDVRPYFYNKGQKSPSKSRKMPKI